MGASATSIDNVPVSSVMVQDVKTAREDQTVLDVCKVMHDNNIGSVVVIRENASGGKAEPTGIVTERDIVHHIATKLIAIQAPVSEVMSKPLVTVRPETSLADTIQTMQSRDFRRLVVVDNAGKMVGIVTDKDIFRAIARNRALIQGILGEQPVPAADSELLNRLRTETLGELFRPGLT
jgi:predicted transcriptional regulator